MPLPLIAAAIAGLMIAIRYIIIAAVQLGIWSLIEKVGLPLLNKAIKEIAQATGATEEEATDLAANEILYAFEAVGIFAITLRSKLPLKVAEALGFTTKGFSKRKLSPKLAQAAATTKAAADASQIATKASLETLASGISTSRGLNMLKVAALLVIIQQTLQLTTNIFTTVGNWIDFANWEGAYQGNFQRFFAKLGLAPDTPLPKARTISDDIWKKIYTIVEQLGPESIAFPWTGEVRPYSRMNLVEAVDHFAASLAAQNIMPTYKNVWGLLLPCIRLTKGGASTSAAASLPAAGAGVSTYAPVKVFTGVLSNGVLGSAQPFSAREDDLINSAQELRAVAQTNAAAFVSSLPGKIVYELRIVNNVIMSDGTKRVGASVQVPNGKLKSGAIKYKYVTNKFAVMTLYFVKKDGTRTKIVDITLGPTDVARFNPAASELTEIGINLIQTVATNRTDDITTIISNTPTTTETPVDVLQPLPNYNLTAKVAGDLGYAFYRRDNPNGQPPSYVAVPDYKFYDMTYGRVSEEEFRRGTGSTKDYTNSGYYLKDGVFTQASDYRPSDQLPSPAAGTATQANASGQSGKKASNLSEYHAMRGEPLPPLAARGLTYQSLGLGAASLYTGTIEQNTKLLTALQGN